MDRPLLSNMMIASYPSITDCSSMVELPYCRRGTDKYFSGEIVCDSGCPNGFALKDDQELASPRANPF
jgi:hypothetical protein